MKRRVVVTGLGTVNPLGINVKHSWDNLISGKCGVSKINVKGYENIPCQIVASVPQGKEAGKLNIFEHISKSDGRSMSLATIFGLIASKEALRNAELEAQDKTARERTGVCVGVGMSDIANICESAEALKKGYSKISPYFVPRILPNMTAGHISMKYGFQGPNHTVSTACATGCHAIGDAFRFIQHNYADVMVCGGAEACITPLAMAGFCRLRALCTSSNESPLTASKPFDKTRDGFVMGEGAAILILEELNHALKRGATILAEILGYGLSGDASHITSPHEEGVGALLAMQRAIQDAALNASNISYINAHATSTQLGDAVELKAIRNLFSGDIKSLAISSTKGAHGHLLGAAGNLETLFTVLALHRSVIPPTINLKEKCEEADQINCVENVAQKWANLNRKIALKNSFGFGGTNASLCLGEYQA